MWKPRLQPSLYFYLPDTTALRPEEAFWPEVAPAGVAEAVWPGLACFSRNHQKAGSSLLCPEIHAPKALWQS